MVSDAEIRALEIFNELLQPAIREYDCDKGACPGCECRSISTALAQIKLDVNRNFDKKRREASEPVPSAERKVAR